MLIYKEGNVFCPTVEPVQIKNRDKVKKDGGSRRMRKGITGSNSQGTVNLVDVNIINYPTTERCRENHEKRTKDQSGNEAG